MADAGAEARAQAVRARQQRWLAQRQAEIERQAVEAEIGAEAGPGSVPASAAPPAAARADAPRRVAAAGPGHASTAAPGPPSVRPEEVIDRLTERITVRLRSELRTELESERAELAADAQREGRQLEGYLASEIASHTCPVCYELMVPPENSPTLLFPCGHTFCASCLDSHCEQHGKSKCPYCRAKIASRALNVSLQQIIQNYVSRKDGMRKPGGGGPLSPVRAGAPKATLHAGPDAGEADDGDLEGQYARELRMVTMRCRILRNELDDAQDEGRALENKEASARRVLEVLASEETTLLGRLEEIQREMDIVRSQAAEQRQKVDAILLEQQTAAANVDLVRRTLNPLEGEREKLEMLLESVRAGAAAEVAGML